MQRRARHIATSAFWPALAVNALLMPFVSPASAATVTEKISITASDFVPAFPAPGTGVVEAQFGGLPPADPITGYFTITFDPAAMDNFAIDSALNIASGPGFASFTPAPANGGIENLFLNVSPDGHPYSLLSFSLSNLTGQFHAGTGSGTGSGHYYDGSGLVYLGGMVDPRSGNWIYRGGYQDGAWSDTSNVVYSISTLGTSAPEPAAWAMLLIGFAGIGSVMRTGRRAVLSGPV